MERATGAANAIETEPDQPLNPSLPSVTDGQQAAARAPKPERAKPERTCIVTRVVREPSDLIRFVVSPAGEVVPDLALRLPGRGIWVTATAELLAKAVKAKAFNRAAKAPVKVPDDLPALVERLMRKRVLEALSFTNKAGQLVLGFSRVEALLASGKAACLLHATDAAEDGVDKLDRLYRAVCRDSGRSALIHRLASSEQMSLALGRSNVVHAGLNTGGATRFFVAELRRLDTFNGRSTLNDALAPVAPAPIGSSPVEPQSDLKTAESESQSSAEATSSQPQLSKG